MFVTDKGNRKIEPIMRSRCFSAVGMEELYHGDDAVESGLLLAFNNVNAQLNNIAGEDLMRR